MVRESRPGGGVIPPTKDSGGSVWRRLLERCVCPACHGALVVVSDETRCTGCGRVYPLLDGIPDFTVAASEKEKILDLSAHYDLASRRHHDSPRSCGYCGRKAHLHGLKVLRRWIDYDTVERKCILDVGCGVGLMTRELAGRNEVWGVDISVGLLKIARLHGLEVVRGSGDLLPFPDQAFDLALCVGVIPYFQDPVRIIEELCRVTRAGGVAIVTSTADSLLIRGVRGLKRIMGVPTHLVRLYSCGEIESCLAASGAQVCDSCAAYGQHVVSTRERRVPLHLKIMGRVNAVMGVIPPQGAGLEKPEG